MDTFPDYAQRRVALKNLDGVKNIRTPNGKLVSWRSWESNKKEIPVVIPMLEAADKDAILAFEAAHLGVDFLFTSKMDGVTYTVQFIVPVQVTPLMGSYYDISFTVGEV